VVTVPGKAVAISTVITVAYAIDSDVSVEAKGYDVSLPGVSCVAKQRKVESMLTGQSRGESRWQSSSDFSGRNGSVYDRHRCLCRAEWIGCFYQNVRSTTRLTGLLYELTGKRSGERGGIGRSDLSGCESCVNQRDGCVCCCQGIGCHLKQC